MEKETERKNVMRSAEEKAAIVEEYLSGTLSERPSYALNYKTPIQFKLESGFRVLFYLSTFT